MAAKSGLTPDEVGQVVERITAAYRQEWSAATRAIWVEDLTLCGCTYPHALAACRRMRELTAYPVWKHFHDALAEIRQAEAREIEKRKQLEERRAQRAIEDRNRNELPDENISQLVATVLAGIEQRATQAQAEQCIGFSNLPKASGVEFISRLTVEQTRERKALLREQAEAIRARGIA